MLQSKILISIFLLASALNGVVLATPAEEADLDQLNKIEQELEVQRDWAKYRWGKASSQCYQNYWVNSCLRSARADYRKEIDPIREQEVALHEVQRKLRDSLKTQEDAERASPEKAAERAANQREFEQKQKDAAARAADLEQRRKDAPKRAQENKAGTQLD